MSQKLWGGRFQNETHALVERFTSSVEFDKKLYEQDIRGSIAHAQMLAKTGIITKEDAEAIVEGLKQIKVEIEQGQFEYSSRLEDIHMHIESRLFEKIGAIAGKLHTARSRNDQVAMDLHLYMRDKIKSLVEKLDHLADTLWQIAEKHSMTVMPGYTHLQKAQPVTLGYHLKAYYYMLQRDKQRLLFTQCGADIMPLGACALAGTTLPIDKNYTRELLGFSKVYENTMDAVSDRDFVMEFLADMSILMVHLSRMAEAFILWCTEEFDFIELDDAFATGSSIMPQKKNPDVLELIRGKSGRVFGNLMSMLTIMKGLPLAYNRDMQEDKEPLFDTVETVEACLEVLPPLIASIKVKEQNMLEAVERSYADATDYAEYLVQKGMPFRQAHAVVGKMVAYCISSNKRLKDLTLRELNTFSELFGKDIANGISALDSVMNRKML